MKKDWKKELLEPRILKSTLLDGFQATKDDVLKIEKPKDFADYLKKYGEERASGYLDAIGHMLVELSDVYHQEYGDGHWLRVDTPPRIRTKLKNYHEKKRDFVELLRSYMEPQ